MSVAGWPAEVDLDLGTSSTPALQHHQHQSRVKVKVKVQRCDEGRVETVPAGGIMQNIEQHSNVSSKTGSLWQTRVRTESPDQINL